MQKLSQNFDHISTYIIRRKYLRRSTFKNIHYDLEYTGEYCGIFFFPSSTSIDNGWLEQGEDGATISGYRGV